MSSVYPDFDAAARKNQAYERNYGQDKSVFSPLWTGAEGDKVALQRSSYPSMAAQEYFDGPVYNQQFRNLLTSGLQGRGKKITDRFQLTGMADYSTYGKEELIYQPVSMSSSPDNIDMLIGVGVLGMALAFMLFYR